jgi:PAS domain S-box-containing protein
MPPKMNPEAYLDQTLACLGTEAWRPVLDEIPLPVYTTDAEGHVTYWNRACAEFAGREPQLGSDRWCVTWHLYTLAGEPLPHDQCPMAQAIRERRIIRNAVAIAERPDGRRRAFKPYPTPLFAADGTLSGAVNMLVDVTSEQSDALTRQADRCRRLADATHDQVTRQVLGAMAQDYERTATGLALDKPAA